MTNNTLDFPFTLSSEAIIKAATLAKAEGNEKLMLRVAVQAGGCSGLRYQLYFDDNINEKDLTKELIEGEWNLKVVCDALSSPYLAGAVIEYQDTINKQGFQIENPNAQGSCACGDSFN